MTSTNLIFMGDELKQIAQVTLKNANSMYLPRLHA